jgi:hypothetical protein
MHTNVDRKDGGYGVEEKCVDGRLISKWMLKKPSGML